MKKCRKILALALALVLLLGIMPTTMAAEGGTAPMPFTDVPAGHWAYDNIATMSQGNLIKGYGDGTFGPDDRFNIDQMCQMICNVKGYDTIGNPASDGCAGDTSYWAYGAVEFCLDCHWLPKQGQEINAETYSVPCTRELAVYMIVKALGYNPAVSDPYKTDSVKIKATDIPDFASTDYKNEVLEAYQLGLVEGVDETRRFNPRGKMTRAEAATMLLNAGWTEGREIPELGEGPSIDELYERIQQLGGWDEHKNSFSGSFVLDNADNQNTGRINISRSAEGGGLYITLYEDNRHTDNPDWYTGSAYSYAGRMRLKEILQAVYPDQNDFEQAWDAVRRAFLQETHDSRGTATAIEWIGHRCFDVGLSDVGSYEFCIHIGTLNSVGRYCGRPAVTDRTYSYIFLGKTAEDAYTGFEFDKW